MKTIKLFSKIIIAGTLTIGIQQTSFAQVNWSTATATGNSIVFPRNNILGTTTNAPGLGFLDIRFFTDGAERMRLIGEPGPNLGFLGIGLTAPAFRLDVQDNINVNTTGFLNGYRINGFTVLWTPGVENTFVGRGAAANFTGPLGGNTFVGFNAGGSLIGGPLNGDRNTFVGRAAGFSFLTGRFNTFIGCDAGLNMVTGSSNTFIGEHAGFRQVSGDNNTYVGSHSGQGAVNSTGTNNSFFGTFCGPSVNNGNNNTFAGVRAGNSCSTGDQNCFYGEQSGFLTLGGSGNVFMGFGTGRFNRGGSDNTYVGRNAGVPNALPFRNLVNANAFGVDAIVRDTNMMILGNNFVNVGIGLSNDITVSNGPTNKLEIDAGLNLTAPQPTGMPGASGLTFRDLHLGNTVSSANGVALSVDSTGEVILVPGAGSIAGANNGLSVSTIDSSLIVWGQNVGQAGNPGQLLNDREIPTDSFNVFFTDPATSAVNQNRVQFGNYTGASPFPNFAKVTAINGENSASLQKFGGLFTTTSDFNPTAVPIQFSPFYFGNISATYKMGVVAIAQDNSSSTGRYIGVSGGAYSTVSQNNVGVSGKAYGSTFFNYGVYGLAGGTDAGATYYGVSGASFGSGTNIGVYGSASGGTTDYAGYFDGDVFVNGPNSGMGILTVSDQNLKINIDTINNALGIISLLHPKTFYFDTLNSHNLKLSGQKQYGLVAQQVETILPELISTSTKPADYDSEGNLVYAAYTYKTLNYDAFIAILMKGMQEQENKIDSLTQQMADMQSQISGCCSSSARTQDPTVNQTDVTLTNAESIVLNQNVPNPFAEQTTITYNLPESVKKAQLLFYDATGKLIKAVDLTARGNGQINVFANDLSNGIYSYALVVDGQVADTKRMVKTN